MTKRIKWEFIKITLPRKQWDNFSWLDKFRFKVLCKVILPKSKLEITKT